MASRCGVSKFPASVIEPTDLSIGHMDIIKALENRDTKLSERLVREHTLNLAAHVPKHVDFLD